MLGFIPNYYVVYDHNAVPLTAKLKFRLAFKTSMNPVTFAASAFIAGIDQAAYTPNYVQGMKGYGQRFGANYANGLTDIMIGGAILPSLLHQDPRYFYQGTDITKSRLRHTLTTPFWCKGDNGRWQPNYSSVGRLPGLGRNCEHMLSRVESRPRTGLRNFLANVAADMENGVLQEFVIRRFKPGAKIIRAC